ncbi:MAG TPA: PQ-loop domain-containing transporter [Polyangiaceae bacterium]
MPELIGWCSSIVLLFTIVAQIIKQWREGSSRGLSPWLYTGQTAASLGFTIYSALLKNWVFTLTNGAMVLSALVGVMVSRHFKRHPRRPRDTNDAGA